MLHHVETVHEGKNTKKTLSYLILPAQKCFQSFHKGKKNQCTKCNEEFLTKKGLLHHVESAHEGKKTNCPNCKVDVEEGEKHQCTHQCTICNEEFSTKNKLVIHRVDHIESVHGAKKWQLKRNNCVTCNIEFWDQGSFDTHLLTVHSNFLQNNGMTSGLKLNHGLNGHQPHNDAKIPAEQSLMPGGFGPPSDSQYGLPIKPPRGHSGHLDSLFSKHFPYKKNKNSSAGIDENQEPEMPKQKVDVNESVKQPMLQTPKPQTSIHKGKKPFKCIICDISYAYKKDLNEHKVKTHEIAYFYNCGNCNSGFFRKPELLEHVSSSHEGIVQ